MASNKTHNTFAVSYVAPLTSPAFANVPDAPMVVFTAAGLARMPLPRDGLKVMMNNDSAGVVTIKTAADTALTTMATKTALELIYAEALGRWVQTAFAPVLP